MSLPFDSSDPAIRLALKHVRMQALTPMSVLINLTVNVICAIVISPSLKNISDQHPTPMNPSSSMLGVYWLGTFVLLILYCLLLFVVGSSETKETIVYGVGVRLVLVQWAMAINVIAFVFQWFIASLVFTSISLALLVWIHITLFMYPPHSSRLVDTVVIHTPIRLLLIITFLQDFPQILFIVLGWYHDVARPQNYSEYQWQAVAFILSFNVVGLIEVALRQDLIWAIAGTWVMVGILIKRPKPMPVFGSALAFAILYPVVYVVVFTWRRIKRKQQQREGQIRLPIDNDDSDDAQVARARLTAANGSRG